MEYFFDEVHYNKLYNCSTYKVEDLPLEMRQKPLLGWTMLAFFAISEIFYVPCLIAIWGHLSQSCYKIMFFIGLTDVCALWICGFLSGFFAIRGDVFCSHPTLIYIAGMFGEMFWGMESIAATLLAANRCILLGMPRLGEFLFDGWRTYFWLLLTFLYSFWYGFFTKSQLFSSVTFTWFFNPHVGYIEGIDDLYANIVDTINSAFVACTISGFYLTFAALLVLKRKQSSSNPNDGAKIIFLQVFILSSMNAIAGTCYVLMAIIQFPDWVGYLGTFMWAFCHGIPPVIYLGINRTLRNDCARMFGLKNGVVGQQQIKNNNNLIVSNTQNSNIQNNNNITPVNA